MRLTKTVIQVTALSLLAVTAGLLGPRFGFVSSLRGLELFLTGLAAGGLASAVIGGLAIRSGEGSRFAWLGLAWGAGSLVLFTGIAVWARFFPAIHDVTTSPEDPPVFEAALEHSDNKGRDLTYPQGGRDVPRLQRQAYPDLVPIELEVSPERALDAALSAANRLGWTMMDVKIDRGRFEAWDGSSIFGFVDDVVVRVRRSGGSKGGSRVDVRSTSRLGRGDVGANARRIRRFREMLYGDIEAYSR